MSFLALPDEIIRQVLNSIQSQDDYLRIAKTCRRLYLLGHPFIYASMNLNATSALKFFRSPSYENILGLVKDLSLTDAPIGFPMGFFAPALGKMFNLEHLQINCAYWHFSDLGSESDDDEIEKYDTHGIPIKDEYGKFKFDWPFEQEKLNDMFQLNSLLSPEPRILPSLISCHIDYHEQNGQAWFIDFEPIFFSSTLIKLSLKECYLHDGDFRDYLDENQELRPSLHGISPLKHLILLDCNINIVALSKIMMIPKALETVCTVQTESTHHEMAPSNTVAETPEEWIRPYTLQSASLKRLYIDDCTKPDSAPMYDLREFRALQELGIPEFLDEICWELDQAAISGVKLPPSLRSLQCDDVNINFGLKLIEKAGWHLRDLERQLTVIRRIKDHQCPHLQYAVVPLDFDAAYDPGPMFVPPHPRMHGEDDLIPVQTTTDDLVRHFPFKEKSVRGAFVRDLAKELREYEISMQQAGIELQLLLRFPALSAVEFYGEDDPNPDDNNL